MDRGKSVTMQSFIPLLLDGKKTPERLDPFGNKARKIEDYVLGYGDDVKEESTSYLYMEFVKENSDNYRTVGMGLRGKRGQGIKFWGFVIKDGRRVGKDILLYRDKSNKIPLTKQELKNRLGVGGEIVETQKEYATLVNNNIFGFESLEEYDEFIKLLIEIRTPKLSKGNNFRPSTVIEILSNSLRPLSDEDLRPVSESIDNMNKTKEQLKFLKQSQKAINKIKGYYEEYNKYLLYSKAKRYILENNNYNKSKIEQDEIKETIQKNQNKLIDIKNKIQDLDAKIKAVNLQEENLRNSKAWNIQKELTTIEEELKELNKTQEEKQTRIEINEKEEKQLEYKIKEIEDEYDILLKDFEDLDFNLDGIAKELEFQEYILCVQEIKNNMRQKYDFSLLNEELKRYIKRIELVKQTLQELREAEKSYDDANRDLQIVKNNKSKQDVYVTHLRNLRDEEKSKMIDAVYLWEKKNEFLKLTDVQKVELVQRIQNYGDDSTYDDIIEILRKPLSSIQDSFSKQLVTSQYKQEEIDKQIIKLKEEKYEWHNMKDPEPTRTEVIIANRNKLKEANIHFVPFYQAVDFREEVDDKLKGIIEAALNDMGILDALIISKEDLEKAFKIDVGFVDKYLVANPIELRHDLSEYLKVSLKEGIGISSSQVVDILKTILIADEEAKNYLDEDGRYKIGLISGKANKDEISKYIGQESRKKYRLKRIEELNNDIEILENKKAEEFLKIDTINKQVESLNNEFKDFPSKALIEERDNDLKIAIQKLEAIKLDVEAKEKILNEKYIVLKEVKIKSDEETKKFPFSPKLESYQVIVETAIKFKEDMYEFEKLQNNLVNIFQNKSIYEDNLYRVRDNLDDLRYELNHVDIKQKEQEEKKISLTKILEREGGNLTKQMEECLNLKRELPLKKDETIKLEGILETDIKNKQEKAFLLDERIIILDKIKNISQNIFNKELQLGYVKSPNTDIESKIKIENIAKDVIKEYNYFDKYNKSISDYLDNLMVQVRMNQEYLVDYNLSIETILALEIEEENQDIISLLQTSSRRDITCFVNGKKVKFLTLSKEVDETIVTTENLIEEDDRKLFEEILTNTVGRKIRERIYHAKDWVKSMNELMETIDTSSKLSFSLNWKPKVATNDTEIDTKELVDILNSDSRILRQEEIKKVAAHFRTKFEKAENRVKEMGGVTPFHDIIKETLDYRTWFEFQFNYKRGNENKKELTNNAFFKLSGGEKAMAMYIPLFAAVTSKLQSAKAMAPRIISLDEAFAGVDDANIRDMFRILTKLGLEYIINSQVLWGEYDTIPAIAIYELVSDPESKVVCVIKYVWNGNKRELIV